MKKGSTNKVKKTKKMLCSLNTKPKGSIFQNDDVQVSIDCIAQLNRYINDAQLGLCLLQYDEDKLSNCSKFKK